LIICALLAGQVAAEPELLVDTEQAAVVQVVLGLGHHKQ
jgi:hypothetical protein